MGNEIIVTQFHYGGVFINDPVPTYVGEKGLEIVGIDKDHLSLFELEYYTKQLGYESVVGFYYRKQRGRDFILLSDVLLLDEVRNLTNGDLLDLYVRHVVPTSEINDVSAINLQARETNSESGINGNFEAAVEENQVGEAKNQDVVQEVGVGLADVSDVHSDDSQVNGIPEEDDSDIDEESRLLRQERRTSKQRKKPAPTEEIPLGEAGTSKQRKKPTHIEEIPLGEAGIDKGFEDIGRNKKATYIGKLGGDEDYIDSSDLDSDDSRDELDPDAVKGVDLPGRRMSKKVRYDPSCVIAIFEVGMIFENAIQFRKSVADYAIQNKVQLKLRPNEKERVRCKCVRKNCHWELFASIDRDSGNFMVKNYYPIHKCTTTNKNSLCRSKYLAEKYKDTITRHPETRIWEIQELVRKDFGLYVGRTLCHRAKHIILREHMGDWGEEFAKLCDYADMIKETNPGSSCWIRTDRESSPGKNLFVYFYVCLDALKKGWLEGCRKIIGFDGCFLKGACKGELLVAIGKNGNQQMFPIAWAVVDQETKHSWSFFINYLIEDLQLGDGEGLTVMSDMQKGLQQVVKDLLPNCERRMCARHIWSNWNHNWRGEERRKQFWRVAKSSFVVKVNDEMAELAKLGLGKDICEDLLHYPKEAWCRAYFQEHSKCDAVENNMCETFNSWILGPRHKSIISMLEDIRHKIMARQVDMIQFPETWISDISPMARHTLDQNKDMSRDCSVKWNADSGFEIVEKEKYGHTVDLRKKTCSCRSWMLRGIPCQHAVCAYYHLGKEPEDYVEKWYRKDYFLKAYKYYIQPIPNMKMWLPTNNMTIEPPALKPMPGRPKRCRRKAKDEPKKWGKMSRKGVKMTCSKCHQQGHNKNFCSSRTGMEMPPQSAGPSRQPAGPSNQPAATTGLSSQAAGPSSQTSTSVCADYSAVRRESQIPHRGRGRGRGRGGGRGIGSGRESSSNTNTIGGQKRSRGATGFGLYTDRNGSQVLNPGTMGERLLFGGSQVKHAAETNGDIGFKPRGLRWMGKNAVTTSQLQQMRYSQSKQFGVSSSAAGSTNPANI